MKFKMISKKFGIILSILGCTFLVSQVALADESAQNISASEPGPFWVNVGVGYANFNSSANVNMNVPGVGSVQVPGGNAAASNNTTLVAEFGYDITKNWAARLMVGIPPTTTLTGQGSLSSAGTLGKGTYGPAVLSTTYGWDLGVVKPYLGAGVNYTIITSTQDGAIKGLSIGNGYGPVLQAGFNVPITPTWGWFVDFKQIFVKVNASGSVAAPWGGQTAASAVVTLNPQIWSTGVSYRF